MYVKDVARGRGAGAALVRAAEKALASQGCVGFKLQVATGNMAAIQFYQRSGWHAPQQCLMYKRAPGGDSSGVCCPLSLDPQGTPACGVSSMRVALTAAIFGLGVSMFLMRIPRTKV